VFIQHKICGGFLYAKINRVTGLMIMIFTETKLKGSFIIKPQKVEDERGSFSRVFCKQEFDEFGLNSSIVQCSVSNNRKMGTFRGMHFQAPPYEEDKIVSCMRGSLLDYIVDLRVESPTFKQWVKVELSAQNGYMLYVPKSFAHGFLTLHDDTQIFYQMTECYQPQFSFGFRYDDPAFDIVLPYRITTISERDKSYPDLYLLPV
jgi:dTDP-4-dehydrorhamnose 3,5-epimerase